jgi:hypothetical protein
MSTTTNAGPANAQANPIAGLDLSSLPQPVQAALTQIANQVSLVPVIQGKIEELTRMKTPMEQYTLQLHAAIQAQATEAQLRANQVSAMAQYERNYPVVQNLRQVLSAAAFNHAMAAGHQAGQNPGSVPFDDAVKYLGALDQQHAQYVAFQKALYETGRAPVPAAINGGQPTPTQQVVISGQDVVKYGLAAGVGGAVPAGITFALGATAGPIILAALFGAAALAGLVWVISNVNEPEKAPATTQQPATQSAPVFQMPSLVGAPSFQMPAPVLAA